MALTIKHLNSDASFLLSFEPVCTDPVLGSVVIPQPFTILLDPWITGPSKVLHSRFSITTQTIVPCILSLSELPEPDLVIISQHKSDHCNEATLRQLPATGTKTMILAEPASARLIRSWKYFDRDKIRTIEPWKDLSRVGKSTVLRIPVPPVMPGGQEGEVTVSWLPQKRDLAGLHGAMGLTYRPPSTHTLAKPGHIPWTFGMFTPPVTPILEEVSCSSQPSTPTTYINSSPPCSPTSPRPLHSMKSASTLVSSSPMSPTYNGKAALALGRCISPRSQTTTDSQSQGKRPISLLFSPHGISYTHIKTWATSHLLSEAALPLTALLHCMDSISNPWWLGGNVCSGTVTGAEIANQLGARVWISAHDAEKDVRGIATSMLKTRKWQKEEIVEIVRPGLTLPSGADRGKAARKGSLKMRVGVDKSIEILRLGSGERVLVTGDGMILAATEMK